MWAEVRTPAPWDVADTLLVEQDAARLAGEAQPA
jgi:hypothetical protein